MASDAPKAPKSRLGWVLSIVIALLVVVVGLLLAPRLIAVYWLSWGTDFFKRILYEDLSLSDAWSSSFAVLFSFGYALALVYLLGWSLWRVFSSRASQREVAVTFVSYFIVFALPHVIHAVADTWANPGVCFNQRTGDPIKWYVALTGGEVVLYDSAGFDKFGTKKQPATQEICEIFAQQQSGLFPKRITADPREVQFFSATTGAPLVWYSKGADGSVNLFDAKGFDPGFGQLLAPITSEVVAEVRAQVVAAEEAKRRIADLKSEQQKRDAEATAERIAAAEKEEKLRELMTIFDPGSYASDVVLLGGASTQETPLSEQAVAFLLENASAALRARGLTTDRIRPAVYDTGHFERLLNGDVDALSDVGLAGKMRSAFLLLVSAKCRPADSVPDVTSCTIAATVRILSPKRGVSLAREYSEAGAGSTSAQALARAAELMQTRYPDIIEGM